MKDSQSKTVKTNDAKKHAKPKIRPEQVVANGQSTLLAFVSSKDESAPKQEAVVDTLSDTDLQDSPRKIASMKNAHELPVPSTPSNGRVDFPSSEFYETESVESMKPIEINDCASEIQEQVLH